MSRPSEKALEITKKWFLYNGDMSIESMNMTYPQKYRAKMVYELYHLFLSDKDIDLMEVAGKIAARDYAQLLEQANNANACTSPKIQELSRKYVEALKIKPGVGRSYSELSNDVWMLNEIVDNLNQVNLAIEKVKTINDIDWAAREGKKMGDAKAVLAAAGKRMELFNNFDEKQNAKDAVPNTEINITGDVTVVKPDNKNLSEEELKNIFKKYGLSRKDVIEMKENGDGVFVPEDYDLSSEE